MNRSEAEKLDNEIRIEVAKMVHEMHADTQFISLLMDENLQILPDVLKKDIIYQSFSIKPGNIRINLKCLLTASIELAAAVNVPETVFNYIQLILLTIIFSFKISLKKLSDDCFTIIYVLHKLCAYDYYIHEDDLEEKVRHFCKEHQRSEPSDFKDAVTQLYKMKTIEVIDAKIKLNEVVWGIR